MSHTKTVIVSNDTGATASTVGAATMVAFIDDAAVASDAPWTAISAGAAKTYQFMTSNASSPRFKGSEVVSSTIQDYTAGTAQVSTVTIVLDSGAASVKLIDTTKGHSFPVATFEASGATATAAAALIATAIGASTHDSFVDFTCTESSGVLTITAPKDSIFRVATNDASSVVYTTDAVLSVGSPAKVKAEVEDGLGFQGVTNIAGPNAVKPTDVVAANTYDRICLDVEQTHGDRTDTHEVVIYILASNNTLNGTVDTFIA